jgi:hypothetical protein
VNWPGSPTNGRNAEKTWLWAGDGSPARMQNLRFLSTERVTLDAPDSGPNERNPNAVRFREKASDTAVKRIGGQVLTMPERAPVP